MSYRIFIQAATILLTTLLLANCESARTSVPLSTQTALPTYTPLATYTPLPTSTPLATYTPLPTSTPVTSVSKTWILKGRLVGNFTSVCTLPNPELSPKLGDKFAPSTEFFTTRCAEIEGSEDYRPQKALPIIIQFLNPSPDSWTLILPWPSDVIVRDKAQSNSAKALYFPFAPLKGEEWVLGGKGTWPLEVKSSAAIELLYLLPKFSGEVTIDVANFGSFKIKASDGP